MLQPCHVSLLGLQAISYGLRPVLDDTLLALRDFELHAEASSDLPVTFTSSNEAVATIAGNVVTIHAGGITTITASQEGNDIFLAAEPVQRILQVRIAGLARHFDFQRIKRITKTY